MYISHFDKSLFDRYKDGKYIFLIFEQSLTGLVKNFSKKVVRGNSVQTDPNFPAKSLSIYTKNFFFNDLTEN